MSELDDLYRYGMLLLKSIDDGERALLEENTRLTEELTQAKKKREELIDRLSGLLAIEQGE